MIWGAREVTGVDISAVMLDAAERRLSNNPHAYKVHFIQGDRLEPALYAFEPRHFDFITGVWFLNYAKNIQEPRSMFSTIHMTLKPGGSFSLAFVYIRRKTWTALF